MKVTIQKGKFIETHKDFPEGLFLCVNGEFVHGQVCTHYKSDGSSTPRFIVEFEVFGNGRIDFLDGPVEIKEGT